MNKEPTAPERQDDSSAPQPMKLIKVYAPRREKHYRSKPPWYHARWVVAAALLIGAGVLLYALGGLTEEVSGVSASIEQQTAALEDQTDLLADVQRAVVDMTDAVKSGFERMIGEMRDAADQFRGGASV